MLNNQITSIPLIIHQIVGPNTNPVIDHCLKSWEELKDAGFEIRVWDDEKLHQFIDENFDFALSAFLNSRNHAEAADIARYLLIYHFGGYYVDWDVQLLDSAQFIGLSYKYQDGYILVDPANGTLTSEFFCAKPKDSYLKFLVRDIVGLYNSKKRDELRTPQYSGPYRMRDSMNRHPETFMVSVPIKEVFAYLYDEIRNPPEGPIHQPLIHYWVHSWM
ncbi:glycosyltransferase [Pedobacter sp. B4-66]|uniref:glycosyltransferase family 32 protein n=1 Tax=Pedobacter sp. B4-66 TaxID=2817280 RepID=UPI001BD9A630|nr:glycosyltransferase [Pedobacter sp. B4-66]